MTHARKGPSWTAIGTRFRFPNNGDIYSQPLARTVLSLNVCILVPPDVRQTPERIYICPIGCHVNQRCSTRFPTIVDVARGVFDKRETFVVPTVRFLSLVVIRFFITLSGPSFPPPFRPPLRQAGRQAGRQAEKTVSEAKNFVQQGVSFCDEPKFFRGGTGTGCSR